MRKSKTTLNEVVKLAVDEFNRRLAQAMLAAARSAVCSSCPKRDTCVEECQKVGTFIEWHGRGMSRQIAHSLAMWN